MESNKDEALKCVSVASRAISEGDLAKAERFASKAASMAASLREVGHECLDRMKGDDQDTSLIAQVQDILSRIESAKRSNGADVKPSPREMPEATPRPQRQQEAAGPSRGATMNERPAGMGGSSRASRAQADENAVSAMREDARAI